MKTIAEQIKKVKESIYFIGELKWVKIGTQMPKGWKKVDIQKGLTLIEGDVDGVFAGAIKNHRHKTLTDNNSLRGIGGANFEEGGIRVENLTFGLQQLKNQNTSSEGTDKNYAAGMYAELWEFVGGGVFKNLLQKILWGFIWKK